MNTIYKYPDVYELVDISTNQKYKVFLSGPETNSQGISTEILTIFIKKDNVSKRAGSFNRKNTNIETEIKNAVVKQYPDVNLLNLEITKSY